MTPSLELELADRLVKPIPQRLAIAAELQGPIQFFEPITGFAPIGYLQHSVYSATCSTRVILPRKGIGSRPLVVHDLRMTEVALDLLKASYQSNDQAEAALSYLILSRLVLEQTLLFPPSIFQAGLLIDRIEIEASQEVAIRRALLDFDDLPEDSFKLHLEQITQFCLVHEVTHYCIFADESFRKRWVEFARDLIINAYSALLISFEDEQTKSLFCIRIEQAKQCTAATLAHFPEIEELICDLSAITSLVRALELKERLMQGADGLLLSVSAAIAGTWLVAAASGVIRDLMKTATADLRRAHNILITRGSFAALALNQIISSKCGFPEREARMQSAKRWQNQPDFEGLILNTLNPYFCEDQLERILIMGQTAINAGLCQTSSIKMSIKRHFGWI